MDGCFRWLPFLFKFDLGREEVVTSLSVVYSVNSVRRKPRQKDTITLTAGICYKLAPMRRPVTFEDDDQLEEDQ